jgi:outer membrane protein TolC
MTHGRGNRLHFLFALLFVLKADSPSQPLTLRQALDLALEHNRTILLSAQESFLTSRAGLEASEAAYRTKLQFAFATTRSFNKTAFPLPGANGFSQQIYESQNLFPQLSLARTILTPFGSRAALGMGLNVDVNGLPSWTYQARPQFSLNWQQPLSRAGVKSGHHDRIIAQANFSNAELNFGLQKEQLLLAVVNGYFQLWSAHRSLERAARELESAQRVAHIAELRLKAKSIAASEALNSRVQAASAQDNLVVAENQLQSQLRRFAQLLGQERLPATLELVHEIEVDTIRISLEDATAQALANRKELRQAEINLKLAELNASSAASRNHPVLQINGNYNLSSFDEPAFFDALGRLPSSAWSVNANLALPLWDGGAVRSQEQIAQSVLRQQQNQRELLRENIALEVEQLWRDAKLNERRLHTLALNTQLAEEALKIAELRFERGQISSNEVEQVRARYLSTQESLNGARISYQIQSAALAQAMGKLEEWAERLR